MKDDIVVGLDLGTSKVACIIGNINQGNPYKIEIIGVGTTESHGLRKGLVVDIEKAAESIRRAVAEAERMAGITIDSVYIGIAGGHIESMTKSGLISVSGKNNEITPADVQRAIDLAKTCKIPVDREIIHVISQGFIIDEQDRVKEPVGMYGIRLEAFVHIVTGAVALAQNIVKSAHLAETSVANIVLEPLATSEATLTMEERENGVLLIDIGGGTTDIIMYEYNTPMHTAILPVGGQHLTNDIATVFRISYSEAEAIKIQKGSVMMDMFPSVTDASGLQIKEDDIATTYSLSGKNRSRVTSRGKANKQLENSQAILSEIIRYRMVETLGLIVQEIEHNRLTMPRSVILTGGTSLLTGLNDLAEQIFRVPVRIGYPRVENGLADKVHSPIYATGVGLLLYGLKQRRGTGDIPMKGNLFEETYKRMKNWFREYF